jgi:hypothetical protein
VRRGLRLNANDHSQIGAVLKMIVYECGCADRLNQFKKRSTSQRLVLLAVKQLNSLRNKLDNEVCRHFPEALSLEQMYYGNPDQMEHRTVDDLLLALRRQVGDAINGRVPVRILDQYLRAERCLNNLRAWLKDVADEQAYDRCDRSSA